jgi:hypothetical protein
MARTPLLTALLHPVNLSMLALTAAAGLCSAWWLVPVGLVLWLIMVVVIARDPGLQLTFTRQNRQPLAPRFQTRFDRLDRARVTVFNSLSRFHSPPLERTVEPVSTALDELVEHAYQLSLRLSAIDNNYTIQQLTNNIDDEIEKLNREMTVTTQEADRVELRATIQTLQDRKAQNKSVGAILTRFDNQLSGTASAVDGVVTTLVGFQGRSPDQVSPKVPALLQVLRTEQEELKQFDAESEKASLT